MTQKHTITITSPISGSLQRQCREILRMIGKEHTVLSITYFFGSEGLEPYLADERILRHETAEAFTATGIPLVSCVAQKPSEGRLTAEVLLTGEDTVAEAHEDYILISSGDSEGLLTQGIHFPYSGDTGEQSVKVFGRISKILGKEGFLVSDIVRQWNYIDHITAVNNGVQNYQLFNDARSRFYSGADWSNGYPAATGIGCDTGGVMVVVYAVKGFTGANRPVDNPLQIPAHKYSENVLASGREGGRTTPKFERGRVLGDTVFVSGTAAIKGESSDFSVDARVQAEGAIDVVEHLVAPENISEDCEGFRFETMRVYVRRSEDIDAVREVFQSHYPDVPVHFLIADICRPELLLELEGIGTATARTI